MSLISRTSRKLAANWPILREFILVLTLTVSLWPNTEKFVISGNITDDINLLK